MEAGVLSNYPGLLPESSPLEIEEADLPTVLHSAPTLLHLCKSLHVLPELRSACRATRLLAQPEITGVFIEVKQPLVASRFLELPDVLKNFRLRRLHLRLHYQGQGE